MQLKRKRCTFDESKGSRCSRSEHWRETIATKVNYCQNGDIGGKAEEEQLCRNKAVKRANLKRKKVLEKELKPYRDWINRSAVPN